jgi:long-chain acyl-CoA synthetase
MRERGFSQVMKCEDALLGAWQATLARSADQAAIFDTRREVSRTFRQIEEEAQRFSRELLPDMNAGQALAVQIGNHPSWPAILLACLRSGIVVVPLEPAANQAAYQICGVAAVASLSGNSVELLRLTTAAATADWNGDAPVLLKLTSGTTAAPRAICFTSARLLADCDQICETMQIGRRDLNYGTISLSHSYGFSNLVTPLIARGVPMVLSSDRMPRAILDGLIASEASVFPGMPVLYQALCEIEEPPPLPALRLCISAGAPLPLKVARNFRAKYQHAIHSFYGSSECGGICYDREALLLEEGFVGTAMERVAVDLIDLETESSRIRVRSAAAASGYFPETEPEKLGGGIFVPDDLLTKSDDGFLINVAGKKVNPAEVEAHLLRCRGVREAVVFARPAASGLRNEEIGACVVAEPEVTEAVLLDHCRNDLSSWQRPKRIFLVESLPFDDRGKLSRRALSHRFSAPT